MKKTQQEEQKLALRLTGYATSAGALLAIGSTVNGQVVYSGLQNLELNFPQEYLEIDLDGDMVNDFGFYMYGYSGTSIYGPYYFKYDIGYGVMINPRTESYKNSWITKLSTVRSIYSTYYGTTFIIRSQIPDGLEPGEIIDSIRNSWSDINYPMFPGVLGVSYNATYYGPYGSSSSHWNAGEFRGDEKYLGVRFHIGTNRHYGWIRLSMDETIDPLTIIDWAYELTPETAILAGDGQGIDLPPYLRITGGGGATNSIAKSLTISANDSIAGLELSDLQVTNGTADSLTEITAGYEYTAYITAASEGLVKVIIPPSSITFKSGSDNLEVSTTWIYDITPPEVNLYPYVYGATSERAVEVELYMDERTTGFEPEDIEVTNGFVSEIYTYSEGRYYLIEVTASEEGVVIVTIPEGALSDMAGNLNLTATTGWTYDSTGPEVTFSGVSENTTSPSVTLTLGFNENAYDLMMNDFNFINCSASNLTEITSLRVYAIEVEALSYGTVTVELFAAAVFDDAYNINQETSISWQYIDVDAIDNSLETGILIYPNPVRNELTVELPCESDIKLINANGEIVFHQEKILHKVIDISGMKAGIYIVQVIEGDHVTQHKIIIE